MSRAARTVAVPNVLDLPLEEAQEILRERGFERVFVDREFNPDVEEGVVFDADARSRGEGVRRTPPIQLTVSRVPRPSRCPTFGMTWTRRAPRCRRRAHLGEVTEVAACVPLAGPGRPICTQDPGAGQEVDARLGRGRDREGRSRALALAERVDRHATGPPTAWAGASGRRPTGSMGLRDRLRRGGVHRRGARAPRARTSRTSTARSSRW